MSDFLTMPAEGPRGDESGVIDILADRFESAWKAGAPVSIAECISGVPESIRPRLVDELVRLDIEYRALSGRHKQIEEYARELPELSEDPNTIPALTAYALEMDRKHATHVSGSLATPHGATEPPPDYVGRYKITKVLQLKSGQADIYLGEQPISKTPVVIKLWRVSEDDADARERFTKEGTILSEISHPNIARVYDMDFHGGRPFLAMEYVRGRSLDQVMAEGLGWRQAARLVAQAAGALETVHALGVLHLDITPRNVMVDEKGSAKLIDFGLSRLRSVWQQDANHSGFISGSPTYLSPEQANGQTEHLDGRTDVFGLGTVLYALLTREAPYRGSTITEVLQKARTGAVDPQPLRRASAPWWLKRVCRRAMHVKPAARYPSPRALAATLDRGLFLWPRAVLVAAAIVLIGIGLALWRPWSTPAPVPSAMADPTLAIYRQTGQQDWGKVTAGLTATAQDHFYFESHVPPGVYAAMVLFTPVDPPQIVQQITPAENVRELRYPPRGAGFDANVAGAAPGTAMVLVLTSRTGPVRLDDLQPVLNPGEVWPVLNENSTLRFTATDLDYVEKSRSFGTTPSRLAINPDEATRLRLDTLRHQLMAKYPAFQGLVFRHQPTPTE